SARRDAIVKGRPAIITPLGRLLTLYRLMIFCRMRKKSFFLMSTDGHNKTTSEVVPISSLRGKCSIGDILRGAEEESTNARRRLSSVWLSEGESHTSVGRPGGLSIRTYTT